MDWVQDGSFKRREYDTYEEYLKHQGQKFDIIGFMPKYDELFYNALMVRLPRTKNEKVAYCLGARQGTEVRALIDLGWKAKGFDVNPGNDNQFVEYGDFHNLDFLANESARLVYSNAIDHALYPDKFIQEVIRLLGHRGRFYCEASFGSSEGREAMSYECFWWDNTGSLIDFVQKLGLNLVMSQRFTYPWRGHQLVFEKR